MDALASSNPAGFEQICAHISVYHQQMSPGYDAFIRRVLKDDIKLRNIETKKSDDSNNTGGSDGSYTFWNVPGMGQMIGKLLPFDIYGHHVFIDEKEMEHPDKKLSHGVMRWAIAAAGVRRKEGGRKLYDYATMNFSLACGAIFGGAFLHHSRRRFNFLQRRPALSIVLSMLVFAAAIPVVRSLFKIFAVGITIAERQHAKALKATQCYDCLCDIYDFSDDQVEDCKRAKLPPPKPGMPPITPEQEKGFRAAMEMQALILGRDLTTIRSILKLMLQRNGLMTQAPKDAPNKSKKELEAELNMSAAEERKVLLNVRDVKPTMLCDCHLGLRADPDHYMHPEKFPIFMLDRSRAKERGPIVPEIEST